MVATEEKVMAAEEDERGVVLLSVDDFEKRGFKIDDVKSQCKTSFDALLVVSEFASQVLLEEQEIEERKKKKQKLLIEKTLKKPIVKNRNSEEERKKKRRLLIKRTFETRIVLKRNFFVYVDEVVHDMPENMRRVIKDLEGDNIKLVIQKRLYHTDMNDHHNRMSIPLRQVREEFLTEKEEKLLEDGTGQMMPLLVQPRLAVWEIGLKKWKMGKGDGKKGSYCYVLQKGWNVVKADNGLKAGDQVQLWSFRINQKLCLALAKVGN